MLNKKPQVKFKTYSSMLEILAIETCLCSIPVSIHTLLLRLFHGITGGLNKTLETLIVQVLFNDCRNNSDFLNMLCYFTRFSIFDLFADSNSSLHWYPPVTTLKPTRMFVSEALAMRFISSVVNRFWRRPLYCRWRTSGLCIPEILCPVSWRCLLKFEFGFILG